MTRLGRAAALAALVGAAALTAGCSQIDSLAAVSGDKPATVRAAAIDVLMKEGIGILEAPVCVMEAKVSITCTGQATSKEPIAVTSTAVAPLMMKVTVGSRTVYEGDAQTVIDEAAQR